MNAMESVESLVAAVKTEDSVAARIILNDETRLRAIFIAASAVYDESLRTGQPEKLAECLFVEVEHFTANLVDCCKMLSKGDVGSVVQSLAGEVSNLHAAAVVSLLEQMRPRSSRAISVHCQKIDDHPELMGVDS
jgi:hypothetical protein